MSEETKPALTAEDTEARAAEDQVSNEGEESVNYKALLKKALDDRKRANAEAQAAKRERDALMSEKEAAEKAKLSDIERAKAEAEEARKQLERERAEREKITNQSAVKDFGVLPQYADYVADKFAAAKKSEGFDPTQWAEDFKKANSAFFTQSQPQPKQSAEGGPAKNKLGAERESLLAQLDRARKRPMSRQTSEEIFGLQLALRRLERG